MIRSIMLGLAIIAGTVGAQVDARPHRAYQSSHYYGPSSGRHYTNVNGNSVHSPMRSGHRPSGATAHCGDGTWSFSQHARGTCSHHGGVHY